jgi:hypothetical protein
MEVKALKLMTAFSPATTKCAHQMPKFAVAPPERF